MTTPQPQNVRAHLIKGSSVPRASLCKVSSTSRATGSLAGPPTPVPWLMQEILSNSLPDNGKEVQVSRGNKCFFSRSLPQPGEQRLQLSPTSTAAFDVQVGSTSLESSFLQQAFGTDSFRGVCGISLCVKLQWKRDRIMQPKLAFSAPGHFRSMRRSMETLSLEKIKKNKEKKRKLFS